MHFAILNFIFNIFYLLNQVFCPILFILLLLLDLMVLMGQNFYIFILLVHLLGVFLIWIPHLKLIVANLAYSSTLFINLTLYFAFYPLLPIRLFFMHAFITRSFTAVLTVNWFYLWNVFQATCAIFRFILDQHWLNQVKNLVIYIEI